MTAIALAASLLTYAVVVSQPLAYLVFLRAAQRAMSAAAYIELRQRINPVMSARLGWVYGSALVALLLLLVAAWRGEGGIVLVGGAVALACLFADVFFMLRENVPINGVVDGWSPADPPADWVEYREKWFAIFATRQAVLLFGFASLVAGAALR